MAAVAVLLASNDAARITGAVLPVDGGYTAQCSGSASRGHGLRFSAKVEAQFVAGDCSKTSKHAGGYTCIGRDNTIHPLATPGEHNQDLEYAGMHQRTRYRVTPSFKSQRSVPG